MSDKMIERLEKGKHVHRGKTSKEAYDDDEDSETDTDEDEFGEELTPEVDAQILRTIAAIRSKTKEAVDPNVKFFSGELNV